MASSSAASFSVVDTVASLYSNSRVTSAAAKFGLSVNRVTWEDTARTKGSCWGPNISDMTLQQQPSGRNMPVIRKPNFSDESTDRPLGDFNVTVGNERGAALKRISLRDYLTNIDQYAVGKGEERNPRLKSLLLPRDDQILTSVQHCLLPVVDGDCEFNVALYNYQSRADDPAVLVIVASSQGTSAQVVTGGTEHLKINIGGGAANYLAKRLSEDRRERGKAVEGAMDLEEQERNVLFIYQIPLKQKPRPAMRGGYDGAMFQCCAPAAGCAAPAAGACAPKSVFCLESSNCEEEDNDDSCNMFDDAFECCVVNESRSAKPAATKAKGIEHAMLRAGAVKGDFKGVGQFTLERDERFPVRCTMQFYSLTDSAEIPEATFKEIREKIDKVERTGTAHGSLVVSGATGRATETTPDVTLAQREAQPLFSLGCC